MKRAATQEEKRYLFDTEVLVSFIERGENALGRLLEKEIPIEISRRDRDALLDRMMRTAHHKAIFFLLNDIVVADGITVLSKDQSKLSLAKSPKIKVSFTHFTPPSKAEGGWEHAPLSNPLIKQWSEAYTKYQTYITQSSRNCNNAREATQNDLPIDMVVTTTMKGKILRFVIFEPIPDSQRGPDLYLEPFVAATVETKK